LIMTSLGGPPPSRWSFTKRMSIVQSPAWLTFDDLTAFAPEPVTASAFLRRCPSLA
jgi:hypothetical protein